MAAIIIENVEPDRRRKVGVFEAVVDGCDEFRYPNAFRHGYFVKCNPKIFFQADAGFVIADRDGPSENARFLALLGSDHSVTAWPSAYSSLSGAARLDRLRRP